MLINGISIRANMGYVSYICGLCSRKTFCGGGGGGRLASVAEDRECKKCKITICPTCYKEYTKNDICPRCGGELYRLTF
ncbi:MAG: hypothetical protein AB1485_02580 [Candidatus Thermoplasmatota archaeon]